MSNNVGGVGGPNTYYNNQYVNYGKNKTGGNNQAQDPKDVVTFSGKSKVNFKSNPNISKLWDQTRAATASLRSLVSNLIGGSNAAEGSGQSFWAMMSDPEGYGLEVDEETRLQAENMIGDEGYYGVDQTTDRIMEFAKALAGDDVNVETIENLRDGAKKGFDAAAKMFGGYDNLPEVTKKTYDAVMQAFDDWKASVAGTAEAAAATETTETAT